MSVSVDDRRSETELRFFAVVWLAALSFAVVRPRSVLVTRALVLWPSLSAVDQLIRWDAR